MSFASVNNLQMYYEIHGTGDPLVLIHGGGSTIESTFGRILNKLAETHKIIAVELQAHGRTRDIERPLSFEQDADDVAELLRQLNIRKADFFGFSNGGTTTLQICIRHPELVNKVILASTTYKRSGMQPGFFEAMEHASLNDMPLMLKKAFLKINPDPEELQAMFERDRSRMLSFQDINDSDIDKIQAPALVINGDSEVVRAEHAMELSRRLKNARLAILPAGHGEYIGEICSPDINSKIPDLVTEMIISFLSRN